MLCVNLAAARKCSVVEIREQMLLVDGHCARQTETDNAMEEEMTVDRHNWIHHVEDVARSRHYTWLPEGLGGEPVDKAMTFLTADIMHICKRAHLSWEAVLERAHAQFLREESEFESG